MIAVGSCEEEPSEGDCCEEEPSEIACAEMSDDYDYVEVSEKEIANVTEESFVVCVIARGDVIRGTVLVTQLK